MTDSIPRLAYRFGAPGLLRTALTHRSAGRDNNERLEFLGDAVLSAIVSRALYERFPRAPEGVLTRLRAELVREASLATLARELDLGQQMHLGQGELRSGGFRRDSILADGFEALIGAIYLDGGWPACESVLLPLLEARMAALDEKPAKDAKTELQELLQGRGLPLPRYEMAGTAGDDHSKTFFAQCSIDEMGIVAHGEGTSRRAAETAAARVALDEIAVREATS
ncbi:MAG TPA: ribonuclease III [Xanthomonadales bacterium]|nr:ribonuclease III [Xanthomonadales bacterium]